MRSLGNDSLQVRVTSGTRMSPLKSVEKKLIKEHKSYTLDFLSGENFTIICPQSQVLQFDNEILPQLLSPNSDMDDRKKICEEAGCGFVVPRPKHELEGLYKSVRRSGAEVEAVGTDVEFSAIVNEQKELEASYSALELAFQRRSTVNLNIYDRRSTVDDSVTPTYNQRYTTVIPEISDIKDKVQAQDLHNHYVGVLESLKLPLSVKVKCRERVAKIWLPSFILNWMFGPELVKAAKALRVLEAKYGLPSPLNVRNLDEKVQMPGAVEKNQFKKLLEENAKHNKKDIAGGVTLSFNGNISMCFDGHPIDQDDFNLDKALNGEIVIRVTAKDSQKLIQVYTEPKDRASSFYDWFAKDYRDPFKQKLRIPQGADSVGEVESWAANQKGEAVYLSGREAVRYILKICKNPS
jgi:hypothetical protein